MAILKGLIVIVERKRAEKICAAIKKAGAHFENIFLGTGTARSEVLSVLGMDSEKAVILSTVANENFPAGKEALIKDLKFGKGGGIAFTVPVSAVSGPASMLILTGGKSK